MDWIDTPWNNLYKRFIKIPPEIYQMLRTLIGDSSTLLCKYNYRATNLFTTPILVWKTEYKVCGGKRKLKVSLDTDICNAMYWINNLNQSKGNIGIP